MGRTFLNIGSDLSSDPSPGHLRYARLNGDKVDEDLGGIGDLGRKIVQQPEYVSCQVDWFWRQFIGKDSVLYPNRKQQLIDSFNQVGRRTKDFIRLMVTAPEFREKPVESKQITFDQIAPLLQRCDSCHSSEGWIPTFSDGEISPATLLEMNRRIGLPESNADKMPKNWPLWDARDLQMVKSWLEQGAVNRQGKARLPVNGSQP
jgi:hypothetical protein